MLDFHMQILCSPRDKRHQGCLIVASLCIYRHAYLAYNNVYVKELGGIVVLFGQQVSSNVFGWYNMPSSLFFCRQLAPETYGQLRK